MKICVLNGSPKGNYSVTLQTLLYLEKKFKDHEFEVVNIGSQIRMVEKDITPYVEKVLNSDLIIFSYPIYGDICGISLLYVLYNLRHGASPDITLGAYISKMRFAYIFVYIVIGSFRVGFIYPMHKKRIPFTFVYSLVNISI